MNTDLILYLLMLTLTFLAYQAGKMTFKQELEALALENDQLRQTLYEVNQA